MKIIRGTKDAKGNVVTKQPAGGVGRLRCMKCQNLMTMTTLPSGAKVMKCNGCGANHTTGSMEAKATNFPGALPKRTPR